jgi:O-antigen ligase
MTAIRRTPAAWPTPALAVAVSVPVGALLALLLRAQPVPLGLAVVAGAGLVVALALTLASEDAATGAAFALLGIVIVEPAPCDGLLFVVMAVALARGRATLRRVPGPALGLLVTLLAVDLASAIQVVDAGRAASFFAITVYLAVFAVWLPGYVTSARRSRVVVLGYLVAAGASAAAGVAALYLPIPGQDVLVEDARAKALFQDPNVFGPFLVPAALIVLEELVHPRLLRLRWPAKTGLLLLLVAGVVLSYSRGAWVNLALGLVVMVAVLAARQGGGRAAAKLVAAGLIAAVGTGGVIVGTGSAAFLVERARPQTYDTERFSGQRAGIASAAEYPFGAGPGQFERVAGISAHSSYARVLGEQGVPGLAVLIGLLAFTAGAAVLNAIRGRDTYGIGSAALLAAWCGLLVNSLVIDTLHWRHLWVLAALIWAGAMRPGYVAGTRVPPRVGDHAPSEYEGRP